MNTSSSRRPDGPGLPASGWGLPRELDDLLDRFGRWTGWDLGTRPQPSRWLPVAEEDELGDAYRVRLELPGIPRDRVDVEVEGRQLCVRGDLGESATQQDSYLSHRSGGFLYRTSLPADADSDAIRADLHDGVLTVTVPRSGPAGRRSVPIGGTIEGETEPGPDSGYGRTVAGHPEPPTER